MSVERTTKFATVVDDLAQAWSFIMGHIEAVGSDPSITISPIWSYTESEAGRRQFETSVSGMVEE